MVGGSSGGGSSGLNRSACTLPGLLSQTLQIA